MRKTSLVVAVCCALAVPLGAQTDSPAGPPPPPHRGFGGPGGMRPMGLHSGKVVTGAPYSADINNSFIQTLADGNTIAHTTTGQIARDKEGRTYLKENVSGGPWAQSNATDITFISDPVAGYTYVLNPNTKIAMRRELKVHSGGRPSFRPPSESSDGTASNDRVETDLGQQTMNGVATQGKSVTRTLAAGTIGNSQPITVKSETWTSPDLQVVVYSKRSDPRMGTSTYSLNNIQRNDPQASLFQVPSDYKIQDAPSHGDHGAR